jgi:hypothetical protein
MGGGILEQVGRLEQRPGVEILVLDQPGCAAVDQHPGVGPLVARRMRVRHDDHRQAQGRDLGERGRARPAHDEVGGGEREQHLLPQERVGVIAGAKRLGQGVAAGERLCVAVLAGHVDHGDPLDEARQRLGDRGIEPSDRLGAAEDQQHPVGDGDPEPLASGVTVDVARVPDRRAGDVAWPPGIGQRRAGGLERDGKRVGETGREPHRLAGDHIALPQDDRDA